MNPLRLFILKQGIIMYFCRSLLNNKTMALELTADNFDDVVLKSDKPVLVDFWAEWCGPCRMVGPIVDELSKDFEGRAVVGKVNVDEHGEIAGKFMIRNIPTLLVFKNGEVVDKQVGATSKNVLAGKLDAAM
jgi:thioredoxin 1